MSTVLIFIGVLLFLVVAHELGHFLVAKAFKIRVDEFGVGYPPRAKKLFTWRGTLFTLNWLPFGGFVKIFGEEPDENGEAPLVGTPGSFAYQKMWKRVLVIAAGILANTVLAMVLYAISFGIGFLAAPNDFPGSVTIGDSRTLVTSVIEKSPAEAAGIHAGDSVLSLTVGTEIKKTESVADVTTFVKSHPTDPITLSIKHGGEIRDIVVTPKSGVVDGAPGIGVTLAEVAVVRLPFLKAIGMGVSYTFMQFGMIVNTLGSLISTLFHGSNSVVSQVSGPVGIAQFAGQAFSLGFGSFLAFVALISVNLAVINLFPFPALDGGRLIIELFSSKGRSKIPTRVISAINQLGFLALIALMLYVTYHDIARLFV